jgi:hypothetical protein
MKTKNTTEKIPYIYLGAYSVDVEHLNGSYTVHQVKPNEVLELNMEGVQSVYVSAGKYYGSVMKYNCHTISHRVLNRLFGNVTRIRDHCYTVQGLTGLSSKLPKEF